MLTLDEIARKEGTDKSSQFHSYCKYYEKHFESIRNNSLTLWEIGVGYGSSIRMWREYFPNSTIVGFDIEWVYGKFFLQNDKTKFVLGNATQIEVINETIKQFGSPDIVIDDGSHYMNDMKNSYENIFPLLNNNGLYCIEDLCYCGHTPFCNPTDTNMLTYIGTKMIDDLNLNKIEYSTSDKIKKLDILKTTPLTVFEKTIFELHMYTGLTIVVKNVI